jgi:hypothetical protein
LSSSSKWFQFTSRNDETCSFVYPVFVAVRGILIVSSLVIGHKELFSLEPVVFIGVGVLAFLLL